MIEVGKEEKSLEVAKSISDESKKSEALFEISKVLIESGKEEKSLEVAKSISDESKKSRALFEFSKVLIDRGRDERALEVAKSISSDWEKSKALLEISKILIDQNKELYLHTVLSKNLFSSVLYKSFSSFLSVRNRCSSSQKIFVLSILL